MSKIKATLENDILIIQKITARDNEKNTEKIPLALLENNKEYRSSIWASNKQEKNRIFVFKELESKKWLLVYSDNEKIKYILGDKEYLLKQLVKLRYKVLKVKINKKVVQFIVLAYVVNQFEFKIESMKFYVDETLAKDCNLKQHKEKISKINMLKNHNIYNFKFNIEDILEEESIINGSVRFAINIEGVDVNYYIGKREKHLKNKKYYYLPLKGIYVKDYAINIRRTSTGNFVLIKRRMEQVEYEKKFRVKENKVISFLLYYLGRILTKLRRKKINLFYEKFASKAEEGVFELCKKCNESKNTKNYFIIDENSPDYEKIKKYKFVVKKYSLKSYWLFYNANKFIASDAPNHLNIIRSNNKYLRKAIYDKGFIFLQHGIIYMKNLSENSHYSKEREAGAEYIIASSEKERDVIVQMLKYDEEQVLKTGLGMYGNIKYNHINNNSEDIVTIMLTWKPYEEQLYNFKESSYYKNVIEIQNMLKKYVPQEKIIIIGHPKINNLLKKISIKTGIWQRPISEALEKTKLLITDYSSICYNCFYRGAGVIFYQPDLEIYEEKTGKLIPHDDEYIGKRTSNIDELENIINDTVINKKIDLNKVRTKEYEKIYKTINEFSDGKNIERIYESLKNLNII